VKQAIFRPAAAADVEEACRWYEQQRSGLGGEFLLSLDATLRAIGEQPEQYPVLHRATRRALLARFPYGLYYRIHGDLLVIIACMHARRDPKMWQRRR
jgi:plasmid stabilization system protein ParE